MNPYDHYLNQLINNSSSDFKSLSLKWVTQPEAMRGEEVRNQLMAGMDNACSLSFKSTKPWLNSLSRGCQLCGEGLWSCLFITGKCNAACFYCPTKQDEDHHPATQSFEFVNPASYAAYLNRFGFKGCSFSGGEPFLVFPRVLDYLNEVRRSCDPNLYIWLYTNGILGTTEQYGTLTAAGLDEVRFDIGATAYNLDGVMRARGIVRNITVEIPAIPDHEKKVSELLPLLVDAGVTNLNLHQLRLTAYNAEKLKKRKYTYLHGEQVVVLESELMALRIMNEVLKKGLPLGVNYCSAQYKRRFQHAGFRNLLSRVFNSNDYISEAGFVFRIKTTDGKLIPVPDFMKPDFLHVDIRLEISTQDISANAYHENEVALKMVCTPLVFSKNEIQSLRDLLQTDLSGFIPDDPKLFTVWRFLRIETGMRDYF